MAEKNEFNDPEFLKAFVCELNKYIHEKSGRKDIMVVSEADHPELFYNWDEGLKNL